MAEPSLSVVVVAYDMAREIPRTIRSLSPLMQRGIPADAYEIILVDNGSPAPLNEGMLATHGATLRLHRQEPAPVSPVPAINAGLAMARGDLIGVMIDGARLASPGLLAKARQALRLHHRPVVGTLGFHLGPKVQMESVAEGYDQRTEDDLLAGIDWEADGYRLFDISVFAASAARGWFAMPSECNALFMPRALWAELGGFDPAFDTPGGGYVNHDTWARACALPDTEVILLLGEGTFHQVHGGIATNRHDAPRTLWNQEYRRLRGGRYERPERDVSHFGTLSPHALRFVQGGEPAVPGRPGAAPTSLLPQAALSAVQTGILATRYRERAFLKSPFDVVLYQQLIDRIRPRTIIEIGVREGGSLLWFADALRARGIAGKVIGVDRHPAAIEDDPTVTVLAGDAAALHAVLTPVAMAGMEHPLLVVDDSAHLYDTCLAVLEFFDAHLIAGDYIVVEDGIVAFLPEARYRRYEDGPRRAVADFLRKRGDTYAIDRSLCDHFGPNVTWNPDGWLHRIR